MNTAAAIFMNSSGKGFGDKLDYILDLNVFPIFVFKSILKHGLAKRAGGNRQLRIRVNNLICSEMVDPLSGSFLNPH